jgi:polyhydroxyalkanoate synthesis regulator phasin
MKDLLDKALALGLGLGITGREQADKLMTAAEKRLGLTKKQSATFVNAVMKKGEAARRSLDKDVTSFISDFAKRVTPVSRKEFEALKADLARAKAKPKKATR